MRRTQVPTTMMTTTLIIEEIKSASSEKRKRLETFQHAFHVCFWISDVTQLNLLPSSFISSDGSFIVFSTVPAGVLFDVD